MSSIARILLFLLASQTLAQTPSLEERLQRLETEVSTLRSENQKLRTDLGIDGRAGQTTIRPAGRAPTISVGGLLQAQADMGDKGDARFTTGNDRGYLRRARLNIQGRFLEEFDFRLEGDFAGSLAEATGARAQLTDGFVNWNRYPAANVKVGQFKTPFGFEQLYADPRLFTIERTLVNDRLTVSRQIGAQIGGDLLDRRVTYATGLFNGTGVNTNANDNDKFMWVGRLSTIAWQRTASGQDRRLSLGVNAYRTNDTALASQPAEFGFDLVPGGTKDNIFTGKRDAGGVDAQLHLGRFDLMGEYIRERFQATNAIPSTRFEADGWYAQGSYYVVPARVQAVVKFDEYDPNRSVSGNRTATWTAGVNWLIKSDDLKFQVDYLNFDIDGALKRSDKLITRLQAIF